MLSRLIEPRLRKTKKSVLLLGPRQVGKSTLCRSLKPLRTINLADEALYLGYAKDPGRLSRELKTETKTGVIVVDEIQRVPALLNSIQAHLDETPRHRFVLTGSSARKLKRGGANLLPGRVLLEHLDSSPIGSWAEEFDSGQGSFRVRCRAFISTMRKGRRFCRPMRKSICAKKFRRKR